MISHPPFLVFCFSKGYVLVEDRPFMMSPCLGLIVHRTCLVLCGYTHSIQCYIEYDRVEVKVVAQTCLHLKPALQPQPNHWMSSFVHFSAESGLFHRLFCYDTIHISFSWIINVIIYVHTRTRCLTYKKQNACISLTILLMTLPI